MTADAAERVVVQWAHLSKYEDDAGYHVLGCSNGSLNSEHFDNQLVRYSPGTLQPDELPQVIISWCRRRPSEDKTKEEKYVAMAIYHPFQAVRDISDRRVMPTDYFCAPYQSLASTEVPYLSMYKAFGEFRIPVDPAKPILLDMPSAPPTVLTHSGEILLAQRAAALLLTEKPVCILGAGRLAMLDRLRFIDAVAALLPYGMRSKLSAATWASSLHRQHKMRLFFADDDRGSNDNILKWGEAEDTPILDTTAESYRQLLSRDRFDPDMLTEDESRKPRGFDIVDVNTLVELAGKASGRSHRRRRAIPTEEVALAVPAEDDDQSGSNEPPEHAGVSLFTAIREDGADDEPLTVSEQPELKSARNLEDTADISRLKDVLCSCALVLKQGREDKLRQHISILEDYADDNLPQLRSRAGRKRIREIIADNDLLKPAKAVTAQSLQDLYAALLKLAFLLPVGYETYGRVEECAGYSPGQRLHESLALSIIDAGMSDLGLPFAMNSLSEVNLRSVLRNTIRRADSSLARLGEWLADPKLDGKPAYAQIVLNVVIRVLLLDEQVGKDDRLAFRQAIIDNKLMSVLQDRRQGEPGRQLSDITAILTFAYGKSLSLRDSIDLMNSASGQPWDAFREALVTMADPRARPILYREFYLRQLAVAGYSLSEHARLRDLALAKPPVRNPIRRPAINQSGTPQRRSAQRQQAQHQPAQRDPVWRIIWFVAAIAVIAILLLIIFFAHKL